MHEEVKNWPESTGPRVETSWSRERFVMLAVSVALTLMAVLLQTLFFQEAGGLWRDEVVSANVAAAPSLGSLWGELRHESFPILPSLVLRAWLALFVPQTDLGFRLFGCLVGTSCVAALWANARILGYRFPVVTLFVFALNPLVVRSIDSVRGYGLGCFFLLLAFACMTRCLTAPGRWTIAGVFFFSLLAAHSLYQNVVLLGALYLATGLVLLARRDWGTFRWLLAAGLLSAASMLPYLSITRGMEGTRELMHVSIDLATMAGRFAGTWTATGPWVLLGGAAAAAGLVVAICRRPECGRALIYPGLVVGLAVPAYLVFFQQVGLATFFWHHAPLLALVAAVVELALATTTLDMGWRRGTWVSAVLALILALASFPSAARQAQIRQTNIDILARHLATIVQPRDLIIVNPWYCGVTFARYYQGSAPWTTLPPVADLHVQRYDLAKAALDSPVLLNRLRAEARAVLESGHNVWVVGHLRTPPAGMIPHPLPPPGSRLSIAAYDHIWTLHLGAALRDSASEILLMPDLVKTPVSEFENLTLIVATGKKAP